MLSDPQIERYSRQIILPQVGGRGQKRLLQASVLVSGESSLQAGALLYLAAAGVGRLGIDGIKELSTVAALSPKPPASAATALPRLNPDCAVDVHDHGAFRDDADVVHLVRQYDLVIAGPDTQLHAACYSTRRSFVCGQVSTTIGWLAVYRGYEENLPCLFCETLPPSEATANGGVEKFMGPFIGTVLATEAIKVILGLHPPGPTKLLQCSSPALSFHERVLSKNPTCATCGWQ
jgi:molybdopterin/thiamine biosynthesis adenylyltransferase